MCFSASASFSAGVLLLGVSAVTLRLVQLRRELPFAAIPLLFAIQQLIEGVVWWTFAHDAPFLNTVMTHAYSFFSHVLWPMYIPVAVFLFEPKGRRRLAMSGFVVAGVAVGLYLLYMLMAFPTISRPTGQHVEYVSPHFFALEVMTLYLLSTTVSPMMSRYMVIKVFGALSLLGFAAAYYFYARWFISVWCFFAAILSVLVFVQMSSRRTKLIRPTQV